MVAPTRLSNIPPAWLLNVAPLLTKNEKPLPVHTTVPALLNVLALSVTLPPFVLRLHVPREFTLVVPVPLIVVEGFQLSVLVFITPEPLRVPLDNVSVGNVPSAFTLAVPPVMLTAQLALYAPAIFTVPVSLSVVPLTVCVSVVNRNVVPVATFIVPVCVLALFTCSVPLCTSTVPVLVKGIFTAVVPVLVVFLNVPALVNVP